MGSAGCARLTRCRYWLGPTDSHADICPGWGTFKLQDRLQSVFNAAARLVFSARRSERITPLLSYCKAPLAELYFVKGAIEVLWWWWWWCSVSSTGWEFRAGHLPAMRSGIPLPSWNSAVLPCCELSPDIIWRRHSPPSAFCTLSHAGRTFYQTYNARRPCLSSGFCMCMEQFAVICQECAVAYVVPSWSWRLYFIGRRSKFIRRS